jgi:hypothetical protein
LHSAIEATSGKGALASFKEDVVTIAKDPLSFLQSSIFFAIWLVPATTFAAVSIVTTLAGVIEFGMELSLVTKIVYAICYVFGSIRMHKALTRRAGHEGGFSSDAMLFVESVLYLALKDNAVLAASIAGNDTTAAIIKSLVLAGTVAPLQLLAQLYCKYPNADTVDLMEKIVMMPVQSIVCVLCLASYYTLSSLYTYGPAEQIDQNVQKLLGSAFSTLEGVW